MTDRVRIVCRAPNQPAEERKTRREKLLRQIGDAGDRHDADACDRLEEEIEALNAEEAKIISYPLINGIMPSLADVELYIGGKRVDVPIKSICWKAEGAEAAIALVEFYDAEIDIETAAIIERFETKPRKEGPSSGATIYACKTCGQLTREKEGPCRGCNGNQFRIDQ